MYTVEEAKVAVKEFWKVLNSDDTSPMKESPFAPSYTFQGQPLTAAETAEWMAEWFKEPSPRRKT